MADALQGTWVFNNVPILQDASWQLSFNSNGEDFTKIVIEETALETLDGGIVYKSYNNGTIDKSVIAYGGDEPDVPTEWNNEAYKTINITSKLSEVTDGDALLAWLQANATKQSTDIQCTVTTTPSGTESYNVSISPTDNCTVNSGIVTVTDKTKQASFRVEFTAVSGYRIKSISHTESSDVNVMDDGNNFAVNFNGYDPGAETYNTLEFTVVTVERSGIQIDTTSNGTITLATKGKYCNSNIDVNVSVPSSGGITNVSTADEMTALLVSENVGKVYRFTGTTDSTYTNGDLYEVVSE